MTLSAPIQVNTECHLCGNKIQLFLLENGGADLNKLSTLAVRAIEKCQKVYGRKTYIICHECEEQLSRLNSAYVEDMESFFSRKPMSQRQSA